MIYWGIIMKKKILFCAVFALCAPQAWGMGDLKRIQEEKYQRQEKLPQLTRELEGIQSQLRSEKYRFNLYNNIDDAIMHYRERLRRLNAHTGKSYGPVYTMKAFGENRPLRTEDETIRAEQDFENDKLNAENFLKRYEKLSNFKMMKLRC